MSIRSRYARIVVGDYAAARVAPPVSGPSVYRRIARTVLDKHGLDPLADPELLVRAEGLELVWGWTPGRHGLHYQDTIVISPLADPLERALSVQHERAHHWMRELGAPAQTEADVCWLTLEFSFPTWLRNEREPEFCPSWLPQLCREKQRRR